MITLITGSSCSSSRKASAWLKAYNIPFEEKRINEMNFEELKQILALTDHGTPELEIRSQRNGEWEKIHKAVLESPNLKTLFRVIQQHPRHFRTPILFTKNKLSIGFNDNEFRSFISRDKRRLMRELVPNIEEA